MRRHLLTPAALLLLGCFLSFSSFAQSAKQKTGKGIVKDETVIIKNPPEGGRTVVEIRNGDIYVNGRSIMSVRDEDATRVHKKIIIENGGDDSAPRRWNDEFYPGFGGTDREPRAMLGVMTEPHGEAKGAVISSISPGSPAEAAGLKSGDIITTVDGKSIRSADDLVQEIGRQHKPGDNVSIVYQRRGRAYTTDARLAEAKSDVSPRAGRMPRMDMYGFGPDDFGRLRPFRSAPADELSPRLGVTVEDRTTDDGVTVLRVDPGSVAASAGLRTGDIITGFDDRNINSVDDLQAALRNARLNRDVTLQFQRGGQSMSVDIRFTSIRRRKEL
jgi:serine protease Do